MTEKEFEIKREFLKNKYAYSKMTFKTYLKKDKKLEKEYKEQYNDK